MKQYRLRIVVSEPPAGVHWAVQLGKDGLLPPTTTTAGSIVFDLEVRAEGETKAGAPRFLGIATQGPPDSRFVYVNSGKRAGITDTCWDRRAKVPLTGITKSLLATCREGAVLVCRIPGTAKDGGPACGSVRLLDGWQLSEPNR